MIDLTKYYAKENKTIAEHNGDLEKCLDKLIELKYVKDENIIKLLRLAIYYHDFGKIQQGFQHRITSKVHLKYNPDREIFHNLLSAYFIDRKKFDNSKDYCRVCFAVLNHHDYCNTNDEINNNEKNYLSFLKPFQGEYRNSLKSDISRMQFVAMDKETILIKGLLHKCDYSASGGYEIEYKSDFIKKGLGELLQGWQSKNKNAKWNLLQKFCMSNTHKNIIAVAQTGMGKTEAGLHWIGDNKGFFVLPLKTAINAMYLRFKKNIAKENTEKRLALLYGDSLNFYLQNSQEELDIEEYNKRGKNMTIPLTVTTPDQIFNFVFKYNGYELKLATLAYSKIVIDEIQMYNPDTLAYLIYGIEWINKLGGKVAIVTATLTPFIKSKLSFLNAEEDVFTDDSIRHNMQALEKEINADDILLRYNSSFDSNKILVVCNTIEKAQKLYGELLSKMDNESELHILHSRFIKEDRNRLEGEIIEFGNTDFKGKGIWISTSVVEASLDIDFDCLFTELYELTSLFQRLGRCNRKGVKEIENTNCYVYLNLDKVYPDMEILYSLSRRAILNWNGKISEADKINLINNTFTEENLKNSEYVKKFDEHYNAIKCMQPYSLDKSMAKFRDIANVSVIPSPVYHDKLNEINQLTGQLNNTELDFKERIKIKDKLMNYIVSIPYRIWSEYNKEKNMGKAMSYDKVNVDKKISVDVIECKYDEKGFYTINYESEIRETEFL